MAAVNDGILHNPGTKVPQHLFKLRPDYLKKGFTKEKKLTTASVLLSIVFLDQAVPFSKGRSPNEPRLYHVQ